MNELILEILAVLVSIALYLSLYAWSIVNNAVEYVQEDKTNCEIEKRNRKQDKRVK